MRRFIVIVLIGFFSLFAACSYLTDFVIVNESDSPVTIRYEMKDYPGRVYPPVAPGVIPVSQLTEGGKQWSPIEFELDEPSRSVTTRLMPGQALRIATLNHYSGHDDPHDAQKFQIRKIMVSGTRGELNLTDEQARTTFTKVSMTLYTLTYR